jgi:hypothetical protein
MPTIFQQDTMPFAANNIQVNKKKETWVGGDEINKEMNKRPDNTSKILNKQMIISR